MNNDERLDRASKLLAAWFKGAARANEMRELCLLLPSLLNELAELRQVHGTRKNGASLCGLLLGDDELRDAGIDDPALRESLINAIDESFSRYLADTQCES